LTELWQGFLQALELIYTFDSEVMQVAGTSLVLAATSCTIAMLFCIPLGSIIHFNHFRGKRIIINIIQTLYSVPTVAIGLFVFILISSAGPFGGLGLLFTPVAIIIGQALLISPIITGLTVSALSSVDKSLGETAESLGASRLQMATLVIREARFAILGALIMGFGRAVSEVGVSLLVGGNIRGFTRTITTAISLETSKGELELSIALGIILLLLAVIVNIALNRLQQKKV
jgi:tungstate transport system permease protein